jgi:hypothetical protein
LKPADVLNILGRVIPDWKKFISAGENIIRFLGDYITIV